MNSILVSVGRSHMNNQIFNMDNLGLNRDQCIEPFFKLREALKENQISLNTADIGDEESCSKILLFDLHKENRQYLEYCLKRGWRDKLILVLWEGPVVIKENWSLATHSLFDKILTWNDDYIDNKKYYKLYWPQPNLSFQGNLVSFSEKKFCTMIAANKVMQGKGELYTERVNAIKFMEKEAPDLFDLYGMGWNKPSTILQRIIPFITSKYQSYKGIVSTKAAVYPKYRFAFCYENMSGVNGYITEKIFDCFKGGCVPIYLGAENITDYVPKETFIDRRNFKNYDELLKYLRSIDERRYNRYTEDIEKYLNSDLFRRFSIKSFIDIMLKQLS